MPRNGLRNSAKMPISKSKDKWIGITLGDPAGIGPEVIAKALSQSHLNKQIRFLLIGDQVTYLPFIKKLPSNCTFLDLKSIKSSEWKIGQSTQESARAALTYLQKAIELLKNKNISALVTGPVSKDMISALGVPFCGHTEFLAKNFQTQNFEMMFVVNKIRMVLATRHIPLQEVPKVLNPQKLLQTIKTTHQALQHHFGIQNPSIVLCGLNPHAGENGKIGHEEIDILLPAIQKAKKEGMNVSGPVPADTLFCLSNLQKYDGAIAMYHDQGLAPLKALFMDNLVNLTIGLPFIRTSPAHGTAFGIAGKNIADPSSMSAAIQLAAQLS